MQARSLSTDVNLETKRGEGSRERLGACPGLDVETAEAVQKMRHCNRLLNIHPPIQLGNDGLDDIPDDAASPW